MTRLSIIGEFKWSVLPIVKYENAFPDFPKIRRSKSSHTRALVILELQGGDRATHEQLLEPHMVCQSVGEGKTKSDQSSGSGNIPQDHLPEASRFRVRARRIVVDNACSRDSCQHDVAEVH
jgi:hypothetical protein